MVGVKEDVADRGHRITSPGALACGDCVHAHIHVESISVHRYKPPKEPFVRSAPNGADTLSHAPAVVRFQKDSDPVGWFVGQSKKPDRGLSVDLNIRRHLHTRLETSRPRLSNERKN